MSNGSANCFLRLQRTWMVARSRRERRNQELRAPCVAHPGHAGRDPEVIAEARKLTERALKDPLRSITPPRSLRFARGRKWRRDSVRRLDGETAIRGIGLESTICTFRPCRVSRSEAFAADAGFCRVTSRAQPGHVGADCGRDEESRGRYGVGLCSRSLDRDRESGWRIHQWGSRRGNQCVLRRWHARPGPRLFRATRRPHGRTNVETIARKH